MALRQSAALELHPVQAAAAPPTHFRLQLYSGPQSRITAPAWSEWDQGSVIARISAKHGDYRVAWKDVKSWEHHQIAD